MHRWTVVVLTALLGATLALPAAAQWKWRDQNGHTQYSDTPPPPSVADKDILQRPGGATGGARHAATTAPMATPPASAASGAPTLAPKTVDNELEAKRKKTEQEAEDKKKAEDAKVAAARAENCARAKAQQRTLDSGVRLSRTNDKGEREFLDDKARAKEAERTRDALASECK
jgi:predicted component of type VI protein secretion system